MKIYVIRHGETEAGKRNVIANIYEPLNMNGINQAVKVGKEIQKLNLNIVFCSPIERARHTLELLNLDKSIPVIIEDRLKERDMGIYEDTPFTDLQWDLFWNYNSETKYPELESMKEVYVRVKEFLDEIKEKYKDKNALLVTHGGVSRAIYWYFYGIPDDGKATNVNKNCKLYEYKLKTIK